MTVLRDCPVLRFAVHEDGAYEVVSPWHPRVAFSQDVLGRADGRRIDVYGDVVELRCTNGGAVYELGPVDPGGSRPGSLVRSWGGPDTC